MSGGFFDHNQYRLNDMAQEIEEIIAKNGIKDPEGREYNYPADIIEKFQETANSLRKTTNMVQRVDMLLSDDDGPESFRTRWAEEVGTMEESVCAYCGIEKNNLVKNAWDKWICPRCNGAFF